jgi:cell division septation protein DedD
VAAPVASRADFVPQQFEIPHADGHGFFDDTIETIDDRVEVAAAASDETDDEPAFYSADTATHTARNTGPLEEVFVFDDQPPAAQDLDQVEQAQNNYHEAGGYAVAPAMETAAPVPAESSADPWDDPLPAWEYSRTEWPIVVDQDRPGRWTRLRKPLITILVLAAIISLYYFVFRPQAEGDRDQAVPASSEAATSGGDEKAAAPAPAESSPTPVQTATREGAAQSQPPVSPAPSSIEEDQVEGNFTLQVAALPDEASAIAYSERLTRAGISTYIVPVESGRRKFFRVRVGRFKTAEDAQRYAAQSRLRGRAAGLSLDFIVADYVNP